jgi:hypothetical protein
MVELPPPFCGTCGASFVGPAESGRQQAGDDKAEVRKVVTILFADLILSIPGSCRARRFNSMRRVRGTAAKRVANIERWLVGSPGSGLPLAHP